MNKYMNVAKKSTENSILNEQKHQGKLKTDKNNCPPFKGWDLNMHKNNLENAEEIKISEPYQFTKSYNIKSGYKLV